MDNDREHREDRERQAEGLLTIAREKPHNEKAEIAVLGAMLLNPAAAALAIATLRFEGAFYRPAHQEIFEAILQLNGGKGEAAMDIVVLADHLEKQGRLEEVGGAEYLATLADSVPTVANIEYYVDIVKQNAVLRRIISSCSEAILRCYDAEDNVQELLDMVEQRIFEVAHMNQVKDILHIKPLVMDAVDYLQRLFAGENSVRGIKTGYDMLDYAITGLKPGELFVLAARPSIGKTAFALNVAANIALGPERIPVGIFSLEMPAQQLVLRLICSESKISMSKFTQKSLTQGEWQDVMEACARLKASSIVIDDTGAIDILELRAKARRMRSRDQVRVLFIDYLQLIRADAGRNASRENEVAKISGALKALAKELDIPVVVLAQLNRQAEQGERPRLSNLRESGAIEQDADVVALLHRERDRQYEQKMDATEALDAELIIAKNRNGSTGTQQLNFFPSFTRFENKARVSDDDVPGA